MADPVEQSQQLAAWWRTHVRPFFEQHEGADKVPAFDKDVADLEAAAKAAAQELSVCFLGSSGVGKSTLINALVAGKDIIVPAGGVGPLTAQALTVRYSDRRRFEVQYHSPQNLWQLIFALEQIHKKDATLPQMDVSEGE